MCDVRPVPHTSRIVLTVIGEKFRGVITLTTPRFGALIRVSAGVLSICGHPNNNMQECPDVATGVNRSYLSDILLSEGIYYFSLTVDSLNSTYS